MPQALNDPNTFLQMAQTAAARGIPPAAPAQNSPTPQVMQFMQKLQQIAPNLQPQQAQAIVMLVKEVFLNSPEERNESGGM